ncbi:MAG: hypothetical protein JXA96_15245 [Sedimentisphaerales bacterium]|nr:hypothetical protein [Sedimentisphaerales bacterium]
MEKAPNITSEEELQKLRIEGKINDEEYNELLIAMNKQTTENVQTHNNVNIYSGFRNVPWQIWVVVALLGLEGLNNLLIIPTQLQAIIWLAVKVIFILGLIKGWKWVFCLSVIVGGIHVLFFLIPAPITALMNLVLIALTISSYRFYFSSPITSN